MKDPRKRYFKPPIPPQTGQSFPGFEYKLQPQPDFGKDDYEGSNLLKGRSALITGGDSGIGRAVAYLFAKEGARVALSYLPAEEKDAQDIATIIANEGGTVATFPDDIQTEDACKRLIEKTTDAFKHIDILVNNAAYQMPLVHITEITPEFLERTYRTNLFSMFYLVKHALSHMRPGSTIINTTSIQAYDPTPILMPYATTKAAIVNFTKSLSQQLINDGIRVNAVAPGPIWTPLNPMAMPYNWVKNFGKQTPMKRPGQPVEVAHVFVFLASDRASYVTGHVYGVTGGENMI